MELWKWELRKIWRPGILAAILLLGAVYYWMFPSSTSNTSATVPMRSPVRSGRPLGGAVRSHPAAERAELDGQLTEELDVFVRQIAAIPEASAAGLTDYESFLSFREEYLNGVLNADGQADMDTEYLLNRVYGGTNWYR